ncbi:unnamed protein product [Durusdinium trenchii]|uniref:Uncharacterized protein n=3 Tax=Durusdinium trenchii TaxID=1381693 RepID=A0ABP0KPF9_9DINO
MKRATPRLTQWVETRAANLGGISVLSSSPALVWAHGLGGCCDSDEARGMGSILDPAKLGRTILRLDLRGHGRSKSAHDNDSSSMVHQYTWSQLAKDMRKAAADSVSRSFYGGEALGAAVALEAAVAAQATRSIDAPPGLVLMRPPLMLAQVAKHGSVDAKHLQEFLQIAHLVEAEGFDSLEQAEAEDSTPFLNGADAAFCSVTKKELQQFRRAMDEDAFAAALRGYAASEQLGKELAIRFKEGLVNSPLSMAADAYGVPLTPGCPVLLLAVNGDDHHPVEAAEELAKLLPNAELEVADNLQHAKSTWATRISSFLRKAWMKEFLTKRVMPQ